MNLNLLSKEDIIHKFGNETCSFTGYSAGITNFTCIPTEGIKILIAIKSRDIPRSFSEYDYLRGLANVEIKKKERLSKLAEMGAEFEIIEEYI